MSRAFSLLFAIICYAIFFATFLYLIGFVGNFAVVPKTVDSPMASVSTGAAVIIDLALIALFGVQHSVMARPGFKKAWTRIVPPVAERSVYVLLASVALIVMFLFWQPIGAVVWNVANPLAVDLLWIIFWAGFGIVLVSTFLINHFELFGLQQAWFHTRRREEQAPQLREPSLYRLVRHPMMAGFFLALWAIPTMTAGHLLLAAGMSVYILVALHYEERDLVGIFGADYEDYRGRVGMLMPRFGRRSAGIRSRA
ncbi:MAG TPA: NnrU family protein [Sphingomicrobium sp.]|jgi:protein-S-isoprenylcysteine O-methyltransferase Ste14|nr:NnrU family protein [Sphingomicrobium sp.]